MYVAHIWITTLVEKKVNKKYPRYQMTNVYEPLKFYLHFSKSIHFTFIDFLVTFAQKKKKDFLVTQYFTYLTPHHLLYKTHSTPLSQNISTLTKPLLFPKYP